MAAVRVLRATGVALAGLAIGIIGGFVQASRSDVRLPWGVVVVPWGVVVVLVVLIIAIRGAAWLLRSRLGAWLLFGGWIAGTIIMAGESPSGDTAISAGGRQWAYLLIGVVVGAASATFPVIERPSLTIDRTTADDVGTPSPVE